MARAYLDRAYRWTMHSNTVPQSRFKCERLFLESDQRTLQGMKSPKTKVLLGIFILFLLTALVPRARDVFRQIDIRRVRF
jgi:hypothetical protein